MVKIKSGINKEPGTPNHDILLLALEVSSRRLNPTYINCDSTFNEPFGTDATYMGCRTRLISNRRGPSVSSGRGNIAFVTMNLPMLALEAEGKLDVFMELLYKEMRLCARQLLHRWDIVRRLKVKDIPFIFGENSLYMNSENLGPDDMIEPALENGSLTIGFCGLAEMCKILTGKYVNNKLIPGCHHGESAEAQKIGLRVVQNIRAFADECCEKFNLNFSVIGSPAETTAGRFAKLTKKKFGVIEGITDKDYFTNSCHVPVDAEITVPTKAAVEGPYHKYCNGGLIFYTEIDGIPASNITGLYKALLNICESDVGYFGFNFPLDFCKRCKYLGAIDNNVCPVCGGTDIRSMKRVTGYFAEVQRLGDGKRAEVNNRIAHFGHQVVAYGEEGNFK